MKRVVWLSLAVAATAVPVAFAQPRAPQTTPRRFLNYLHVGTCVVLNYRAQTGDSYELQILTAKQVEQRPEEFARLDKLRQDLAELDKRQDEKDRNRKEELLTALHKSQLGRRASPVYEVIAVGEDFVELRLKLSATGQKTEVQSTRVLPAARIREIRVPIEADRQKAPAK